MNQVNWSEKLKEALDRTEFMAISTTVDGETWTNPVAFAYDGRLNLYFISMLDSKHSQNILKNPKVSAAIFKTERFPSGDVLGLQLKGRAEHVTDAAAIKEAAACYFSRGSNNDEFRGLTSENGGPDAVWQFFKIVPTEVWCFDSRAFGEKRVRVPLEDMQLK